MLISKTRIAVALAALGLSSGALAQSTPNFDAGKALQQTQPLQAPPPRKAPEPVIVQPEDKPMALPAGQTLVINNFRFEGADYLAEEELQAAVESFKGKALSMADIEAAAERVTALYRARGYLVARAYVPRQDASTGTLTIRVLVGQYGKVSVRNSSLVNDARIEGYFSRLGQGNAVHRDDLERAMLLVGDVPGASLPKLTIAPGTAQGASDFDVEVAPGKRFGGYVMGDNFGSRYTGENRLSVAADWNSPFALGDQISFSGMGAEGGGLLNGRLGYSLPLGSDGLRGGVAFSRTTYELGDIYSSLDAVGRADSLEANMSYPIQRSRYQNLTATLTLASRHMRDELRAVDSDTRKSSKVATLGLTFDRYDNWLGLDSYLNITGGLTHGRLDIPNDSDRTQNQSGANTVGEFSKANVSVMARVGITEKLSAMSSLEVQKSLNRNLDSSEQLMISGTRGVMAYEQAVSGDNGYLFNMSLRYALPSVAGVEHALGVFYNTGRIHLQNASYTTTNGVQLSDAGLSYAATYKGWFALARVAQAIDSWPDSVTKDDRTRFLLQAGLTF